MNFRNLFRRTPPGRPGFVHVHESCVIAPVARQRAAVELVRVAKLLRDLENTPRNAFRRGADIARHAAELEKLAPLVAGAKTIEERE